MDDDLALKLTFLLEGALPLLDAAAEREKRREAGKSLRQITEQERAKAAHKAVAEAFEALGVSPT